MSELHLIVATGEVLSEARLEAMKADLGIRAIVQTPFGGKRALTYVSAPQDGVPRSADLACVDDPEGCADYLMYVVGTVWPCHLPERTLALHVLIEVRGGSRSSYAQGIAELQASLEGADIDVAGAHLFGDGRWNFLLEVSADDPERAYSLLLDVLDKEEVLGTSEHAVLPGGLFRRETLD